MTTPPPLELTLTERIQRGVGRGGFRVAVIGLVTGTALFLFRQDALSAWVLSRTVAILILLPLVNVVAVLTEEIRRKDWIFVGLALTVLALIGYTIASRIANPGLD